MLIGGLEIKPEPNVNILVILRDGKNEEVTTDNESFHLLCTICASNVTDDQTKIYWLRGKPPTVLPAECTLQPRQLSRITLRYFNENLVRGIVSFCSIAHKIPGQIVVIVEFNENDMAHEETLPGLLALLTDMGNYYSTVSKGAHFLQNIFPVTALIRTSRIYEFGLVASLYTNCIIRIENGIPKNMLA
ncbi:unnamed protein product [Thelazia callipaeda]|uniref:Ig-like domain-containing protein n=1 Tax=Thelazia callipaeda TaxID=103827 RepID=A0A0N5CVJ1_THECL|nr:unnamed protein product [Thelazia callipaeda]